MAFTYLFKCQLISLLSRAVKSSSLFNAFRSPMLFFCALEFKASKNRVNYLTSLSMTLQRSQNFGFSYGIVDACFTWTSWSKIQKFSASVSKVAFRSFNGYTETTGLCSRHNERCWKKKKMQALYRTNSFSRIYCEGNKMTAISRPALSVKCEIVVQ